jgi:N-acetylneuraminate lyase
MTSFRLTGLIAAPYTAFHADGSLNLGAIEKQAQLLTRNHVTGAFVCGTTGEGLSLTTAERQQVADEWIKSAGPALRVIVHVGHAGMADSLVLAAHAQKSGAAAIGCLAPCFFKAAGVNELVRYCAVVAAAAPELPFYYYHIPSMTGVNFPVIEFLQAAADLIPNLAGVKFTYENLMDYSACLEFGDRRFDLLFGRDEILIAGLSLGARGAIGSTYNYVAPGFLRIIAAFDRGDMGLARAEQVRANAVLSQVFRRGGLTAGKAVMEFVGIDCGPTRLPLCPMTPAEKRSLRQDLEAVGFESLCCV